VIGENELKQIQVREAGLGFQRDLNPIQNGWTKACITR
jgi:hypothetical protein